jgi:hypothetical protein
MEFTQKDIMTTTAQEWLENQVDKVWGEAMEQERQQALSEAIALGTTLEIARSQLSDAVQAALSPQLFGALNLEFIHDATNSNPHRHVARVRYKEVRCQIAYITAQESEEDEPFWWGMLCGSNWVPLKSAQTTFCSSATYDFECAIGELEQSLLVALGRWSVSKESPRLLNLEGFGHRREG